MNERISLAFALLVSVVLLHRPAIAQPAPTKAPISAEQRQAARDDFIAARESLKAGQFQQALTRFRRADDVMGVPTTRLGVAEALAGMGRLTEAHQVAKSIEEIPAAPNRSLVFEAARQRASKLAESLAARIGSLSIVWRADTFTKVALRLNNKPVRKAHEADATDPRLMHVGLQVDPGKHTLLAAANGYQPFSTTFEIAEGADHTIKLQLIPQSTESPDEAQGDDKPPEVTDTPSWAVGPVTWTGIGVTGAGLLIGVVAGALTLSDASRLDSSPTVPQDELDNAYTTSYVSTAGFALAGAGVAAGLIGLLVVDPSLQVEGSDVAITPVVGPGWVNLRGTF